MHSRLETVFSIEQVAIISPCSEGVGPINKAPWIWSSSQTGTVSDQTLQIAGSKSHFLRDWRYNTLTCYYTNKTLRCGVVWAPRSVGVSMGAPCVGASVLDVAVSGSGPIPVDLCCMSCPTFLPFTCSVHCHIKDAVAKNLKKCCGVANGKFALASTSRKVWKVLHKESWIG